MKKSREEKKAEEKKRKREWEPYHSYYNADARMCIVKCKKKHALKPL